MSLFKLHLPFKPAGDQEAAIKKLENHEGKKSTLLGVTGSGKTFTIANVIAKQDKPVIVLSPNKTLAAQLYEEFSLFFPENKVCYFVSYYDYYQPESYLPAKDMYIPKETKINPEIERLRIEAVATLMQRRDVIIIASVSCIYSLGNPREYAQQALAVKVGQTVNRREILSKLVFMQYSRNDVDRKSGTFAVQGNVIEVCVPYEKHRKLRIELFGDEIEGLSWVDKQNNHVVETFTDTVIFPAKNFVTSQEAKDKALIAIEQELNDYLPQLQNPIYAERLRRRVMHDLEMIEQTGFCTGIENYSSYFDGRAPGQPPFCLFDFFKKDDFLLVIDESHIAVPQISGMYHGDRVRKKSLIDFGFRLPSAADNRPLKFEEVEKFFTNTIFVSATPGSYELEHSDQIVEQVIRPTGLLDPILEIHPRKDQITDLLAQIKATTAKGFRSLVTVLTKKMAEELASFLEEKGLKVCYLHSDLKTPQRTEILQKLRVGVFDCVVGVNLLREGIDLPEVAFVAIMDADIEGFLRDKRSLVQIIGRAARNTESVVRLYADKITHSMQYALDETARRRSLQQAYNKEWGITPKTVVREVVTSISKAALDLTRPEKKLLSSGSTRGPKSKSNSQKLSAQEVQELILQLETAMHKAAENLDFEKAIQLREQLIKFKAGL
ncbi:MAG: excinuclease ABC subunit UvrB [Candidatus Dependentiae bacterium]|nr:excinuclease ABC subunit UvrB [Candidatus Dependentiae bacterium]